MLEFTILFAPGWFPIEGLLRTPALAYEILLAAEKEAGVRFRVGVGLGGIETAIRPQAIGMDGPAFHRARRALDECRKSGRRFTIESDHPASDKFVTCYVSLLEYLRQSWTERQVEVIRRWKSAGPKRPRLKPWA